MRWILGLTLAAALLVAPASAQVPEGGKNQIITNGTGRVDVAPTQAVVTVGIQVQRPSAADAGGEATRVADQMLTRLRQLGVRPQDIRTSGVMLQPAFTTPRDGTPQIAGYLATYTLTLTLTDLKLVGPAIDESVKAGANIVHGVSFGLRDAGEARRDALAAAVREGREKADVIARAAGLQIKGIERIVEEGVEVQARVLEAAPRAPGPGVPTPVEPGLITVTARVSIVFTY